MFRLFPIFSALKTNMLQWLGLYTLNIGVCGRLKMSWFLWHSKRDTDVKSRLLDSMGEGKSGMTWENSLETCILSYVKQIASPGPIHETGCSGLVHQDQPEKLDGEGSGRGFRMGNTCTPMADLCQCLAESTTIL